MAKKAQPKKTDKLYCENCKHHYGDHEVGADGRFFLTKCPFYKWSRFLRKDSCERLEKI